MSIKEFDRIIGYSTIKKELEQIADILKNGEVYAKLGISAPRGLLLHGEPGVGKTLMACCMIKATERKYFVCRKNKPNGDFVKHIKNTFNKAVENAPSIVFLDDMDKFANSDENHRNAEEYVTIQSCIDEVKDKNVFVLATTNNLHNLPDSLLRAGRFDRIIKVKSPIGEDAASIIEHYIKNKPFDADLDAKSIERILSGCSCAELETVINEAGLYAGFERSEKITMDHFIEACMRIIFKVPADSFKCDDEDWFANLNNADCMTSQIVYHEAGHAVISEVLIPESVTLVSAYNRLGRQGGFTKYYNDDFGHLQSHRKKYVVAELGGMAAIEQKFGLSDSGNRLDLISAFDMVRDMVVKECSCGFSLREGEFNDSVELMNRQEQAVALEIERYYRKAKEIISLNWDFFEKLAAELAKKKILNTDDIQKIKAECKITPVAV
ncbi:MAG: AAA family ATPase [Eubacterium sp.]|nr:AAA family ATPase [Eubacterium sp.]